MLVFRSTSRLALKAWRPVIARPVEFLPRGGCSRRPCGAEEACLPRVAGVRVGRSASCADQAGSRFSGGACVAKVAELKLTAGLASHRALVSGSPRGLPCTELRPRSGQQEPPAFAGLGTTARRPRADGRWSRLLISGACLRGHLSVPFLARRFACIRRAGLPAAREPRARRQRSRRLGTAGSPAPPSSCTLLVCRDRPVVSGWVPQLAGACTCGERSRIPVRWLATCSPSGASPDRSDRLRTLGWAPPLDGLVSPCSGAGSRSRGSPPGHPPVPSLRVGPPGQRVGFLSSTASCQRATELGRGMAACCRPVFRSPAPIDAFPGSVLRLCRPRAGGAATP